MITVKLSGGLGNQMFQYALGRNLAIRLRTSLGLDISDFKNGGGITPRTFSLTEFNINASIFTDRSPETLLEKVNHRLGKLLPYYLRKEINEKGFEFDHNILAAKNNSYLNGYWQSEKYFKAVAPVVVQDFTLKKNFDDRLQRLFDSLKSANTVSVHFRRGDYVNNETVKQTHGFCDLDYYKRAVSLLKKKVDNMVLVVFSDDLEWVKNNFKSDLPVIFAEGNGSPAEDIVSMSRCRHNIIANSTFSWWGAWLNQNPGKIVVAPKVWFASGDRNAKDVIPESWIKT